MLWGSLQDDVLDSSVLAELSLGVAASVGVDYEDVGFDSVDSSDEVHDSVSVVDECVGDVSDGFHHEESFLLGVDGFVSFIVEDGLVASDSDVEVAVLCCLSEEFDVSAV